MKKRWLVLCLAALLTLTSSMTALAEERQGKSGWNVSFDGKNMNTNFGNRDFADEIGGLEPGDSVELTVTLRNGSSGKTDWYMRNEVLEALEDAGDAAGGAYDYLLTYTAADGETTTLYSSELFGGEGRYRGVGLRGVTETLDEYFYLDRLGKDDTGVIKLKVALEAEAMVGTYQNTSAVLQMDFAVEKVSTAGGGGGGADGEGGGSGTTRNNANSVIRRLQVVQTDDQSRIMLYVTLMFLSGLGILVIVIMRLRRENEEGAAPEAVSSTGRKGRG